MKYLPQITDKEIEENHARFGERASLYRKRGLDFAKNREFILKKSSPLKGNILEIGTGRGHMTLFLARAGYKFISIDIDKESLKIAALNLAYEKLLSSVRFYVMDGKSLTFKDNNFKNIIAVNLFHHIEETDKILSEINRVLCAGGKAVLADFNKKGMDIVGAFHKEEGKTHEDCGARRDYVYSYFHNLGYNIRNHDDTHHWVLIVEKRVKK